MQAKVVVFLKPGVLDVQGKAVESALAGLGYAGVSDVRIGRILTLQVEGDDRDAAESQIKSMCARLLVNGVIERFDLEIAP